MANESRRLSDSDVMVALHGTNREAIEVCLSVYKEPGGMAILACVYDHLPSLRGQDMVELFKECDNNALSFMHRIVEMCVQ